MFSTLSSVAGLLSSVCRALSSAFIGTWGSCGSTRSSRNGCVAVCCSMLQCVAVCCSVLQCVAVCHMRQLQQYEVQQNPVYCSVLQCVAVYCSVLQCVAVCVA